MAIKIAEKPISEIQLGYLSDAKENPEVENLSESLLGVCHDEDITSGKEAVHPEWLRIFYSNAESLRKKLSSEDFNYLQRIFRKHDPFDPEVRNIDVKGKHLTFLLGAGASKPSGIPTVKELLPDLLARARRLEREDLQQLADFCDKTEINNIEDLLTAAHLSEYCSHNPNVLRLVEFLLFRKEKTISERKRLSLMGHLPPDLAGLAFLQDTLQVLFGLLSSRMLPARPNKAHEAIATFIQAHKSATIITTNYDCCMDLALGTEEKDFTYHVTFANAKTTAPAKKVPLIKLHGSLNWFYCETCQKVHLINIKKAANDYLRDKNQYPVIAVCRECNGQRRGLLVPPQAMKFDVAPPLNPLLEHAQTAFNQADIIVVVGFSFADADIYISRMITKALQSSRQMHIIVFDTELSAVEKLRHQLSLRIEGFDTRRILSVMGDCEEYLPCFLTGNFPKPLTVAKRLGMKRLEIKGHKKI